jgi:hypothetical protein
MVAKSERYCQYENRDTRPRFSIPSLAVRPGANPEALGVARRSGYHPPVRRRPHRPVQAFVLLIEPREPERHEVLRALTDRGWAAVGCAGTRDAREVLRVARPMLVVAWARHARRIRSLHGPEAPATLLRDDGTPLGSPLEPPVATVPRTAPTTELLQRIDDAACALIGDARPSSGVRTRGAAADEGDAMPKGRTDSKGGSPR